MRRFICSLSLAISLLSIGCGEEASEVSPLQQWCEADCDYYARCQDNLSADCASVCVEYLSDNVARFRGEVVELAATCVGGVDCSLIEEGEYLDVCFDEAAAKVAPSKVLIRFCDALSPVWFNCGYKADEDECLKRWSRWSDRLLEQALSCAVDSCEEMDVCLSNVFQY